MSLKCKENWIFVFWSFPFVEWGEAPKIWAKVVYDYTQKLELLCHKMLVLPEFVKSISVLWNEI